MKNLVQTLFFKIVKVVWRWLLPYSMPIEAQRKRFETLGGKSALKMQKKFPAIHESIDSAADVRILKLKPRDRVPGLLLYLHGGAFCLGSIDGYRESAYGLAQNLRRELWLPEYRLGPEHIFPAALDDALVAYRQALKHFSAREITLIGDSAGGGLALKLLERLRKLGNEAPGRAVALSPWTDLSQSGETYRSRRHRDIFLSKESLDHYAKMVLGANTEAAREASALFGEGPGPTPILILCGDDEVLLDDTLRYQKQFLKNHPNSRVVVAEGMPHVYSLFFPFLKESKAAIQEIENFIRQQT
jgi:monoterpene epsilon-lactone hydrolase